MGMGKAVHWKRVNEEEEKNDEYKTLHKLKISGVRRKIFAPWLKFAVLILSGFFIVIEMTGRFRYFSGENLKNVVPRTPMLIQAEVPERVFRGNLANKKLVALTFDDGPSAITTPKLLDILKEKGVVATFFELGGMMRNNPEVAQRTFKEGHEIASHTMYHQNLLRLSKIAVEADINEAKSVFVEVLGREAELTRLPYGNSNATIDEIVGTPIIYWTVDTRDWEVLDTGKVIENVLRTTREGSIVLMHDIYATTIDAVPEIVDRLREQGYEFVTVSELAEHKGVKLENGITYYGF